MSTNTHPPIRFAAIGLDHRHIYGQVGGLLDIGGECVGYATDGEPEPLAGFTKRFPDIPRVDDPRRLLEDPTIQLIVTAGVPAERAGIAVAAMRHGKDVMTDKPGATSLDQLAELRQVQTETGQIWSINFSERFEVPAVTRAAEIVQSGAIGTVVQTLGLGPHRLNRPTRPDWFFQPERYGGILGDIASHQIDQFLYFTGSTSAQIVSSAVGNFANPDDAQFEDFGEVVLRSDHATGYIRVDWYTPDGLPTWGDGRLVILGTGGYIELRKYVDIAGRPGTDHLFVVTNGEPPRYEDCSDVDLPYFRNLVQDIHDRTETAMPQTHAFLVTELALTAEAQATRIGTLATSSTP